MTIPIWLLVMEFVAIILACHGTSQVCSKDLVVMRQCDTIFPNIEDLYNSVEFKVDVPMDGPRPLVDSVMVFINRQLYDTFEKCVKHDEAMSAYAPEDVFSDDAEHLLSHYMEKYRPLINDSICRGGDFTLEMEAQTPSYVTFGIRFFHCDKKFSCGSEKYYFTFDKRDGHQVREIISQDNLFRFFEDYPEYKTLWSDTSGWAFLPESSFDNRCYGLLDDHFSLVVMGPSDNFLSVGYPYGQIFSYLSREAQELLVRKEENEPMLPAYFPKHCENGKVWMELDSVSHDLLGHIRVPGGYLEDTLAWHEPQMEIYPKRVHSIETSDGSYVYLFIYSRGHLLFCDEALMCKEADGYNGLYPDKLFNIDGQRDSVVCCMWYDQLMDASNGFPYDEMDENRFGIHYDWYTKRLYIPITENHEEESEFHNCLRYTGRFDVLSFNGKEFVPDGTDGAWWLNPGLRNYKRTISNRKTSDGIEQIDLMPDGTFRRAFWKGAKTLDDLRKKSDEVKISKQNDFKE